MHEINTAPDVTETESQDKVPLTVHNGEEKKPRDSHASDSGISAEYGELFKTDNPMDSPTFEERILPPTPRASPSAESHEIVVVVAPPPSLCDQRSPLRSENSDLSSPAHTYTSEDDVMNREVVGMVLEELMQAHLRKDKHWMPGRNTPSPRQKIQNLKQMEEAIGKSFDKRINARKDARRVMELFLARSLKEHPDFTPGGHFETVVKDTIKIMRTKTPSPLSSSDVGGEKLAPKSISLSKRNEIPAPPSPAAARWQAAAGTAIADQTMVVVARPKVRPTPPPSVEKVTSKRRSYYAAMQEEPEEDQCLAEIADALPQIAMVESAGISPSSSPVSLIQFESQGPERQHYSLVKAGGVTKDITREINETSSGKGIHVHMHKDEVEAYSSPSTEPSSDENDGSVNLSERKKKSLFTRATERLKQSLKLMTRHQAERADSLSESEQKMYSVRQKKIKKKKKKRVFSIGVEGKHIPLSTHKHLYRLKGNATQEKDGAGLNIKLGESESESQNEAYKHGILDKVSAEKIRRKLEKEKLRAKEREIRILEEMLKESKKRKKAKRSESVTSSESIFKRFSLKRGNKSKVSSPTVAAQSGDSTKGFHFNSLFRKKKPSESSPVVERKQPPDISNRHSRHLSDETKRTDSSSLQLPESHTRSLSAEVLPSHRANEEPTHQPRLMPFHSRSRSAQDALLSADGGLVRPDSRGGTLPAVKLCEEGPTVRETTQRDILQTNDVITIETHEVRHRKVGVDHSASRTPRDNLGLPLRVDASVTKTQEIVRSAGGQAILHTTTDIDEVVHVDEVRLHLDTDSELDRLMSKPYETRTQDEQTIIIENIVKRLEKIAKDTEITRTTPISDAVAQLNLGAQYGPGMYKGSLPARSVNRSHSRTSRSSSSAVYDTAASRNSSLGRYDTAQSAYSTLGRSTGSNDEAVVEAAGIGIVPEESSDLMADLSLYLREKGDGIHQTHPYLGDAFRDIVTDQVGQYATFQRLADGYIPPEEPQVRQIAALFSLTAIVMKGIGKTSYLANQVKENALQYIEDKFAQYIIGHGGWDSVIEESASDWSVD